MKDQNKNQEEIPQLKLEGQLCFPLYAAARKAVNAYTPLLKPLGLTYTQYIVLLALWDGSPVRPDGCGTAETVEMKLHNAYREAKDRMLHPEDGAVIRLHTPRAGNAEADAEALRAGAGARIMAAAVRRRIRRNET